MTWLYPVVEKDDEKTHNNCINLTAWDMRFFQFFKGMKTIGGGMECGYDSLYITG
jgi:hypothetical protein